jgi:hypothetical protein
MTPYPNEIWASVGYLKWVYEERPTLENLEKLHHEMNILMDKMSTFVREHNAKGESIKPSKVQLQIKIKRILDETYLATDGWEAGKSIMIFNSKPIGATINCRDLEIGRWWPDLKAHLAEHIANELSKK